MDLRKIMSASWLEVLSQQRAIAVIRATSVESGILQAKAVTAGGIRLIEITWNSSQPEELIAKLRELLPECQIGVGTLLSIQDAQTAIHAGAEFCVSPHYDPAIVECALQHNLPVVPGALTPSEIVTAWQAGATAVKVFPISTAGGPAYIRNLQGPLSHIPLLPTGGVTLENAAALIDAGAIGVGLSSSLFPKSAIAQENWQSITHLASQLLKSLQSRTEQ
jgi:2-dehydro-3-deoxyphosphogluconate aldolase/(4S)-4-hydroxy-2-oxoglutarate aldolase